MSRIRTEFPWCQSGNFAVLNPLTIKVPDYIETSQLTGFYMMENIGR